MDNNKKSDVAYRLGPAHFQFQNGCQFQWNSAVFVQVMVYTFFLWEITQKFFFLAWGFHILATRKNIFCHPGGSQWARGGLLACFRAKKCYFGTNVDKNQSLLTFKDIFLTIMTSKHCRTLKVTLFTNKNV